MPSDLALGFVVLPGARCEGAAFGLVELLDVAEQLGFGVTVRDETHYWETRDTGRLLAEVHAMNRIVARIAGRVSDAMPQGLSVESSIFSHPDFEHLEMEE